MLRDRRLDKKSAIAYHVGGDRILGRYQKPGFSSDYFYCPFECYSRQRNPFSSFSLPSKLTVSVQPAWLAIAPIK